MAFSTIFILLICGICTNMVSAIFWYWRWGIDGANFTYVISRIADSSYFSFTSLTIVMCTALINLLFFYKQKNQN